MFNKSMGALLILGAFIIFLVALGMSVELKDGIANLDLMNMRTNWFIMASSFLISGTILVSAPIGGDSRKNTTLASPPEKDESIRPTTPPIRRINSNANSTPTNSDVIVAIYRNNKIRRNKSGNYYVDGSASNGQLFPSHEAAKDYVDEVLGKPES